MNISEIMIRDVATLSPNATVKEAAERMKLLRTGFLPVCENGRLLGTITDRDITIRHVASGLDPNSVYVRSIMMPDIFYCFEDETVEEVGRYMRDMEVNRVLILDHDHKLVGAVSVGDVSKALGKQHAGGEPFRDISDISMKAG